LALSASSVSAPTAAHACAPRIAQRARTARGCGTCKQPGGNEARQGNAATSALAPAPHARARARSRIRALAPAQDLRDRLLELFAHHCILGSAPGLIGSLLGLDPLLGVLHRLPPGVPLRLGQLCPLLAGGRGLGRLVRLGRPEARGQCRPADKSRARAQRRWHLEGVRACRQQQRRRGRSSWHGQLQGAVVFFSDENIFYLKNLRPRSPGDFIEKQWFHLSFAEEVALVTFSRG